MRRFKTYSKEKLKHYLEDGDRDKVILALIPKAIYISHSIARTHPSQKDDLEGVALLTISELASKLNPNYAVNQVLSYVTRIIKTAIYTFIKRNLVLDKKEALRHKNEDGRRILDYMIKDLDDIDEAVYIEPDVRELIYFEELVRRLAKLQASLLEDRLNGLTLKVIAEKHDLPIYKVHKFFKNLKEKLLKG